MTRRPAVAGQFYSGSDRSLSREVESLVDRNAPKEDAIGVLSPHAGYVYSGGVAGSVLSSIRPKETYIIIGPNHTGLGREFSMSKDRWSTPLGEVAIDGRLAEEILKTSKYIKEDELAHLHEHSIEVQLPFLQVLQKDFKLVPIVASYSSPAAYKAIGSELAAAVKALGMEKDVTMIASSDMTHYESHEAAKKKDEEAISAILKLDEDELARRIEKYDISMCGYASACVMLSYSKKMGATKAMLVEYRTSGDASGDYSSVVGYAGIVVY